MLSHAASYFAGARKQESTLIPRDEVERALLRFCSPPTYGNKPKVRPCISDENFHHISILLKHLEQHIHEGGWSSRPRTYTVLRNIGRVDLMPAFIAEGLKDYAFPYSFEKLPEILLDDVTKDRFMSAQKDVLTQATQLESGAEGSHAYTKNGDDLYFVVRHLGSGGYG